jgi:hypothetical protein
MRKFLYIIGIVSFALFTTITVKADAYYTNSRGIEMTETEYNNLLNLAFTEDQIDRMDYRTFIDNKDLEGEIVAQEQKLFKITTTIQNGVKTYTYTEVSEPEYLQMQGVQNLNPGYSPNLSGTFYNGLSYDYYRNMQSYIVCLYDTFMRYKVDVQWNVMPSDRSWDIIGIGIESDKVHIISSITFRADWKTGGDELLYTENCAPKEEETGGSAMFELPSGSLQRLEAYTYFLVYKNTGVGTLSGIEAVGDYAHATETVDEDDAYDAYTINHAAGFEFDSPFHNSYESSIAATAIYAGAW